MRIILVIGIVLVVLVGFLIFNLNDKEPIPTDTGIYHGAVQRGYDEDLFRKTGRYEKIGVKE